MIRFESFFCWFFLPGARAVVLLLESGLFNASCTRGLCFTDLMSGSDMITNLNSPASTSRFSRTTPRHKNDLSLFLPIGQQNREESLAINSDVERFTCIFDISLGMDFFCSDNPGTGAEHQA